MKKVMDDIDERNRKKKNEPILKICLEGAAEESTIQLNTFSTGTSKRQNLTEKVKREMATERLMRNMDAYEIVEWIHKLEDEITVLEEKDIKQK